MEIQTNWREKGESLSVHVLPTFEVVLVFSFSFSTLSPSLATSGFPNMFSSSQFDATSAFSGGGFMPFQPYQLANSNQSPARSRDIQGLISVTEKQISEAFQSGDEKSNFIIDGVDVTNSQGGALAQTQMADSSLSTALQGPSNVYQPALKNNVWNENMIVYCFTSESLLFVFSTIQCFFSFFQFSVQYITGGIMSFDKLVLNYLQQPSNMQVVN
ncbi:hypothetical protein DITRI_Ditri03aG0005200 [Diplodiscus trichospermus]